MAPWVDRVRLVLPDEVEKRVGQRVGVVADLSRGRHEIVSEDPLGARRPTRWCERFGPLRFVGPDPYRINRRGVGEHDLDETRAGVAAEEQ